MLIQGMSGGGYIRDVYRLDLMDILVQSIVGYLRLLGNAIVSVLA